MRTREEHQQDVADQTRLFAKVANLFDARCAVDPSIIPFARLPFTLVLRRNRCLLTFQQGSGRTIGFGQIRWHPDWPRDSAAIRSTELWVLRSKSSPMMFQLNDGPADDLDSIARDVVDAFLDRKVMIQAR